MTLKTPDRRGWIWAVGLGAVALSLPFVVPIHHHDDSWWNHVPGFFAFFGFVGCAAIVIVSKWLGSAFLQKPEDWYE